MVFNSNSDNQDLVSLLNDLTGADNNIYPLVAKTRDMNMANRIIWTWIHEAYGGWLYDDGNNTLDFPTAKTTLTTDQKDYQLPSDALTVRGVEVKNQSGVWEKLQPITEEAIRERQAELEFMDVSSQPMYYTPYANSIRIYPASNYTQAASLRVSYDRGTTAFASTDTTKTPGFASEFHEAVAIGGAVFYSMYKTIPQKNDMVALWKDYEKRIKAYYSARYKEMFPPRMYVNDALKEYL